MSKHFQIILLGAAVQLQILRTALLCYLVNDIKITKLDLSDASRLLF